MQKGGITRATCSGTARSRVRGRGDALAPHAAAYAAETPPPQHTALHGYNRPGAGVGSPERAAAQRVHLPATGGCHAQFSNSELVLGRVHGQRIPTLRNYTTGTTGFQ